jgi:hypothetical protein
MPRATQLVISVTNKPGSLARVASILGDAGVNIKSFLAPEVTAEKASKGDLRVLVSDLERARAALKGKRIRFRQEDILILSLENTPGALRDVADILTTAKINIQCGYCTPSREGKRAIVVLTVSDTQKALDVLRGRSLDEF